MPPPPTLITFDVFGTILDWQTGLEASCREAGRSLLAGDFERIIDRQAQLESEAYQAYSEVTRRSLVEVLGMPDDQARAIGEAVGEWPPFEDAKSLRPLMQSAPCAAMTNSDRVHGRPVQRSLGFELTDWLCAEDVGFYKPDHRFWTTMSERRGISPGPSWWHVSAYADYDMAAANSLGLTTVFIPRPHSRPGPSTLIIDSLSDLAELVRVAESDRMV